MILQGYRSLVFDCDGVVLNSNEVKTKAFYNAALPYGEAAAQELVGYHVANGGISRYQKFQLFLDEMVPQGTAGPSLDQLLEAYATEVCRGLLNCEVADGLERLREAMPSSRWLIVSGGDQSELRDVFAKRGLSDFFDGGIFGSPDTKHEILMRELTYNNILYPGLFIGDTRYDHLAAKNANLDFVFVSQWTEFKDWEKYCKYNSLNHISAISDLSRMLAND